MNHILLGSVGDMVSGDGLARVEQGLSGAPQVALGDRDVETVDDGEGRDPAGGRPGPQAGLPCGSREQDVGAVREA